ncbi:MAG: AAA family ATPase [Gammaproteobacteria bacterium]|nr:AAA family ATPase [Gammaproteobacteria bacterium]MBU1555913.1 AAA family ATPase [Gammaproteobacteria bacterium]MBU2069167.1 AAA family ATPase [Gammaproteobacteria bacterium]MBU2184176.1 AAA family ATPase [Gammaproteobacteria bacterium]MBU2204966.1 AAA family ATPase [Gammaproteobacteria bacterium]
MSQSIRSLSYTKARFFKCALQVNSVGYIRYRGQQQTLTEDEYNLQLLNAALEAEIEVVGFADHGSVNGYENLRDLFILHGIVVFPGFEVASSEKIHFVCLFDESTPEDLINRHLGWLGVDINKPEAPVQKTAIDIINYVNEKGGFIYAAHSTSDDGVLKRRMNHVWKQEGLLAAQIPGSIEDLRCVEDDFYRKAFLNKDANYCRERAMAVINAADVAKPDDIKNKGASCLIKMTKPCFTSFKQAFLDAGSRVRLNSDKPEIYASAIERLRFVGGYLDGVNIELSDHLNAVIGGRGTGKSTLLECIRFAFDLQPFGKAAKAQHDAIIKNNLGNEKGLVEVTVRSAAMHGRRFVVNRKFGNQPVVVDEEGGVCPYQPKDLLPGIELYGQNEIYEMTRDEQSRNQLIERFLEDEHQQFDLAIGKVLAGLKENRTAIERAFEQKADIEAEVERLPKLMDQAKQFQALGIEEKLKIIPKLEKEKQLNGRVKDEIERVKLAIESLKDSLPDTMFLSDTSLNDLPHVDLLRKQREILEIFKISLVDATSKLEKLAGTALDKMSPLQQQLIEQIRSDEQQLEDAFKDIPASQGKTGRQIGVEYQTLLTQIERVRPKQVALQSRQAQIDELYNHRKKLLLELDQQTSARATAMQRSVKQLNRKLDQKVRLRLQPEANRQVIVDFLSTFDLEGVGMKRLAWVLEGDFSTGNLAATIRQGEGALFANFGLTGTVVRELCRVPESKLLALEELVVPDTMAIELNVTHGERDAVFKGIEDLSTGQQCTAVLHLLLLDNQDPLILDQPEDNLDNAFIADRIVAELRRAKLSRQFLFATHNANIPVFGDAEWIGVLSVEDGKGLILPEQQGAIDVREVQKLAADILEGGKSAFNQRREKYGFK